MRGMIMCIAIGAMALGLAGCEPTTFGKKNVLINLAELGENIDGKSIEEIEKVFSKKGFTLNYEWSITRDDYYNNMRFYSNGIQLDSTWFEDEDSERIVNKVRMQEENACILMVDYYKRTDQIWVELVACYILPNDPIKDYKTLSNDLYRYYSTNYPSKTNDKSPKELIQAYNWNGWVLDLHKEGYDYSNVNDRWAFALQAGLVTQEEYDKEMSTPYNDGWRNEFLQKISEEYIEVEEYIQAINTEEEDKICRSALRVTKQYDSFFDVEGITIAEGSWVGFDTNPWAVADNQAGDGRLKEKIRW